MIIDAISITVLDGDSDDFMSDDQFEITLFPDSGSDIYPEDVMISEDIQEKINSIKKLVGWF